MSAETLRRAASLMRERAEAATPGGWRVLPIDDGLRADVRTEVGIGYDYRGAAVATAADSDFGACPTRDAEHIASWHPAVAIAVAAWLGSVADAVDKRDNPEHVGGRYEALRIPDERAALAVSRTYLGESA